jgi:hypothetical protein
LQLATQVARLLESGNSQAFVDAFSATVADWQAVMPTGMDPAKAPNIRDNGRALERWKKAVTTSSLWRTMFCFGSLTRSRAAMRCTTLPRVT